MNNIKYILALILILSLSPNVYAEEEVKNTDDRSVRTRIENKINAVKDNVQERKEIRVEDREENRAERRSEFAKKHSERISKRFSAYYERINKIIIKVETRISDNITAREKLNEAKSKLETAKKLGDEAVTLFSSITTGNLGSNSETVQEAKDKANEARIAFVDTMKLVRDAIKITKDSL